MQDLQVAIETSVRTSQSRPRFGEEPARGTVFMLRADLMTGEARALLHSVARVVLVARRGTHRRTARPAGGNPHGRPATRTRVAAAAMPVRTPSVPDRSTDGLEFFNGLGGFAKDGREYVTVLRAGQSTPAPWINVIANPGFGFQVATEGSGYTWSGNSRENQLTPWSNDPVTDPPGEAIYLRDEDTGELFEPDRPADPRRRDLHRAPRPWLQPLRAQRAGTWRSISSSIVPLDDPIKISRLTLRNLSNRPRRLSVTAYVEWVLGTSRGASGPFITTEIDAATGAMFARNPWSSAFGGRVAFADMAGRQSAWTGDRARIPRPQRDARVSGSACGAGVALGHDGRGLRSLRGPADRPIDLAPDETIEIVIFLGETGSADAAQRCSPATALPISTPFWPRLTGIGTGLLGAVQVKTPDRAHGHHAERLAAVSDAGLPRSGRARRSIRRAARMASATSSRTAWP